MTTSRAALPALALTLLLAACAQGGTTRAATTPPEDIPGTAMSSGPPTSGGAPLPGSPSSDRSAAAGELVLRIEYIGGFMTPQVLAGRMPLVSVYRDGRVISERPVTASHQGPALPDVQVRHISPADVQALVDRAVDAGVGQQTDLGRPGIADAPTTRFTVVTGSEKLVRDVYALGMGTGLLPGAANGLSEEQRAGRERLQELVDTLTGTSGGSGPAAGTPEPYVPTAISALAWPWTPLGPSQPAQPERPWPGPALPGDPAAGPRRPGCVTATGAAAEKVLAAARQATTQTPWASPDGRRWTLVLRPLLPDESGCADLRLS